MGNALAKSDNQAVFNDIDPNNELVKYILEFYKKQYIAPHKQTFDNFMIKKACCTNSYGPAKVNITLPSVDDRDGTIKIVPTTLAINNFIDANATTCRIEGSGDYKMDRNCPNSNMCVDESNMCNVYMTNHCDKVLEKRAALYPPEDNMEFNTNKYYGPYGKNEISSNNPFNILNPFPECNCLNSIFKKETPESLHTPIDKTTGKPINDDVMTQNVDDQCIKSWNSGIGFKLNNSVKPNFTYCNNYIASVTMGSGSKFNFSQNCGGDDYAGDTGDDKPKATDFLNQELIKGFKNLYLIIAAVTLIVILLLLATMGGDDDE